MLQCNGQALKWDLGIKKSMITYGVDIQSKFPNEAEGNEASVTGLLKDVLIWVVHKVSLGLWLGFEKITEVIRVFQLVESQLFVFDVYTEVMNKKETLKFKAKMWFKIARLSCIESGSCCILFHNLF